MHRSVSSKLFCRSRAPELGEFCGRRPSALCCLRRGVPRQEGVGIVLRSARRPSAKRREGIGGVWSTRHPSARRSSKRREPRQSKESQRQRPRGKYAGPRPHLMVPDPRAEPITINIVIRMKHITSKELNSPDFSAANPDVLFREVRNSAESFTVPR